MQQLRGARAAGPKRNEQIPKIIGGVRRETVERYREDIALTAVRKMELDGKTSGVRARVVVWLRRDSREVREAHGDGHDRALHMRRLADGGSRLARREFTFEHDTLCVYGPRVWLPTEGTVQGIHELRRRRLQRRSVAVARVRSACRRDRECAQRGQTCELPCNIDEVHVCFLIGLLGLHLWSVIAELFL